jgi:hypothetical protein
MTPKEKAEELFNQYANVIYDRALTVMQYEICKQCALIAVEEILSDYKNYLMHENTEYKGLMYWQEVKKEIEAL